MKIKPELGNTLVITMTIILFTLALFLKGFTHDLLLEAGVLLVSIKLIMMAYKNSMSHQQLIKLLGKISKELDDIRNNESN